MIRFFLFEDETSRRVLNTLESVDSRGRQARKQSIAVVKTGKNQRGDELSCGFGGQKSADAADAAELKEAGLNSLTNKVMH